MGREIEYEEFVKKRDFLLIAIDKNEQDARYKYDEFVKTTPYWISVLEMPLIRLYEQGLVDESISSKRGF